MDSLLSPLQVLLETYFPLGVIFILIFGVQKNVAGSTQFHQNVYNSRSIIAMKVRFVLEFSRLKTLQLSFREFCLNMLANASNFSCNIVDSSSILSSTLSYLYICHPPHANMLKPS